MTDYEFWSLSLTAAIWLTGVWGIWRMDQKATKRYAYWDEQARMMQEQSGKSDTIMEGLKEAISELRAARERVV